MRAVPRHAAPRGAAGGRGREGGVRRRGDLTVATPNDAVRAEALERAHDRVEPDGVLDALAALELYVEAFLAGARFADGCRESTATTCGGDGP